MLWKILTEQTDVQTIYNQHKILSLKQDRYQTHETSVSDPDPFGSVLFYLNQFLEKYIFAHFLKIFSRL